MRAVYVTAIKSVLGMAVRDTYKGTEGKQGWKNHEDFHGRSTCPSSINMCKRNRSEQSSLAHYFNSVSHYVTSCNAWCFLKSATLSYACVLVTGFEISKIAERGDGIVGKAITLISEEKKRT